MGERINIDYVNSIVDDIISKCDMVSVLVVPEVWEPNTNYSARSYVRPTEWNGYIYRAANSGTSSLNEPDWTDSTVVDRDITWEAVQFPPTFESCFLPPTWSASTNYHVGSFVKPSQWNGFVYKCTSEGQSGTEEPVWATTEDDFVVDGTVEWQAVKSWCGASKVVDSSIFSKDVFNDYVKLTVHQILDMLNHTSDTAVGIAFLSTQDNKLLFVSEFENHINIIKSKLSSVEQFHLIFDAKLYKQE